MMQQNPNLQWGYFHDDDAYIRTDALEATLLSQSQSITAHQAVVLAADFDCASVHCSNFLCGGGGFAANRQAIEAMVGSDTSGFKKENMRRCRQCGATTDGTGRGPWPDAGIGEIFKARGLERRVLPGLHPWLLEKSCFDFSLRSEVEPLVYHPMRTQPQFDTLHRLFSAPGEDPGTVSGFGDCSEFKGNVQCSTSQVDKELPWFHSTTGDVPCNVPGYYSSMSRAKFVLDVLAHRSSYQYPKLRGEILVGVFIVIAILGHQCVSWLMASKQASKA
jgi:hypothetical protein